MYAITGATGHTGSVVAERLLAKGQKVRVIGRDANRLARFASKGAEVFAADLSDTAAATRAFRGAQAVYAMIPPNMTVENFRAYQEQVTDALAAAAKNAGVTHVVTLSSVGADKADGTGPIAGLHSMEEKFNAIAGLRALHLRAGYFMENTLAEVGVIKSMGMMAGPLRGNLAVAMVAARDVGGAAADALERLDFDGKTTREFQGPREVSYDQLAELVGAAINKPKLAYHKMPGLLLKPAMKKMGMSSSMADLIMEMADAFNSGHAVPLEPRTPQNTGTTTIETFVAEVFVPAFRASQH